MAMTDDKSSAGPTTRALWYDGNGGASLRDAALRPLANGAVRVRTLFSALSRGTERLVFTGRVPLSEQERMRCPHQDGAFPGPVKYGYQCVGEVVEGPADWVGRMIFALHPHQTLFDLPLTDAVPVPDAVPASRAVMAANMETALNILWDSQVSAGDRILIVGGGVVGLLVARLAAAFPGADVTLCDTDPARVALAGRLGLPFQLPNGLAQVEPCDIAIHTSGHAAGLQTAIDHAGSEARIVEASWYGDASADLRLGGAFHSQRLSIVSSQVGQVPPARAPRWSYRRRLEKALDLLADPALDVLLADPVDFSELPEALPRMLLIGEGSTITETMITSSPPCPLIRYTGA
jgi:NADPH:quinone reductase-like Zn-dependent oxidoreductase